MGLPSPEYIAQQRRAEQAIIDRYAELDRVIDRVEALIRRADETARMLTGMPNCDGAPRLQEANDLRQVIDIVKFVQANLDRVHLLEEPSRRPKPAARAGGRP